MLVPMTTTNNETTMNMGTHLRLRFFARNRSEASDLAGQSGTVLSLVEDPSQMSRSREGYPTFLYVADVYTLDAE